jgi:GDP-L-fucose synthase
MTIQTNPLFDLSGRRVWVAGHRGMVGSALLRRLRSEKCEILTVNRESLDLRQQAAVERWMRKAAPDVVFVAAAKVGGIVANDKWPADFLYDNLAIETNIVEAARQIGVRKLLFLGSSCIYPGHATQPLHESALMTGPLEPTNQWYAIAKIAGIMLCQAYRRQHGSDFISVMPTNLYGPEDNFDLVSSHVIPALIAKAHATKADPDAQIVVWGSGSPRREFLHVNDLADAAVFLMKNYSGEEHVNVGVGDDITINELAGLIAEIIGVKTKLRFDSSMPDGSPRKLLDSSKLNAMGWKPQIGIEQGLRDTYAWFLENIAE